MIITVKEQYQPEYKISDVDLTAKVASCEININDTIIWHEELSDWISLASFIAMSPSLSEGKDILQENPKKDKAENLDSSTSKQVIKNAESGTASLFTNINVYQKCILLLCAFAIIGMIAFPPFKATHPLNHTVFNMGYGFIFSPPSLFEGQRSTSFIDAGTLLIQTIAVLIVAGVAFLISEHFRAKSKPHQQKELLSKSIQPQLVNKVTPGQHSEPKRLADSWMCFFVFLVSLIGSFALHIRDAHRPTNLAGFLGAMTGGAIVPFIIAMLSLLLIRIRGWAGVIAGIIVVSIVISFSKGCQNQHEHPSPLALLNQTEQSAKAAAQRDVVQSVAAEARAIKAPSGLLGATWLMTPDQVRSIRPNTSRVDSETLRERAIVFGRPASIDYLFRDNLLTLIIATFDPPSEETSYNEMQRVLSSEFGAMPNPVPTADYTKSSKKVFDRFVVNHVIIVKLSIPIEQVQLYRTAASK